MELQDCAHIARLNLFFVVGIHQKRERGAVGTGGRLDDIRHDVLVGLRVEIRKFLAGEFRVL